MPIEFADFYEIFMEEGSPFYNGLFQESKNEFNEWVSANFEKIVVINSFSEVIPNKRLLKKTIKNGYIHLVSQCHYSAKAVCLLNQDIDYYTGFIQRQDFFFHNIVTHSFNCFNDKVIDFARLDVNFEPLNEENAYLPHDYYGIKIPKEFVKKYNKEIFELQSMNPLLVEWYKECKREVIQ